MSTSSLSSPGMSTSSLSSPGMSTSSLSSNGMMSPRVMEQISAVEANKIFADDEQITFDVSPPLSAPTRQHKAFWSGLLVETDVKIEDSSEERFPSKYTVPTLELAPRRIARRRTISVNLGASRPPSRQQTAFPMDLDLDLALARPEQKHQSRQETSTAACTHKDKHKIRNLRELLSDSDRDHIDNMAYNQSCNDLDMTRPSSCAARVSSCDKPSEQGNANKSAFIRPKTRRKVNALHLDDLPSHTEFGDRRALSDRNDMESKYKNAWVDMTGRKTRRFVRFC